MKYVTILCVFTVILACQAQDICPEGSERQFFVSDTGSSSWQLRTRLNFHNATSTLTDVPFHHAQPRSYTLSSYQLPNILVLEYSYHTILEIYYQRLGKHFELIDHSGSFEFYAVFEVKNTLFYCGGTTDFYDFNPAQPDKTDCSSFNTDNGTWHDEPTMQLIKGNRQTHIAVTIFGQPCIFSPGISTECLNTTSMTWYVNSALPVFNAETAAPMRRAIVHKDVLYICGMYMDDDVCKKYALEPNGFKNMNSTQFPGFHQETHFELFVRNDKVYIAVIQAPWSRPCFGMTCATMFEVDNPENKIEIVGEFMPDVFMSICSEI